MKQFNGTTNNQLQRPGNEACAENAAKHYCNPLNLEYRYQFLRPRDNDGSNPPYDVFREAADPSLTLFKGIYYLFPSVTGGFFTSKDLINWDFHPYQEDFPAYDYAPDIHPVGDWLYVCASKMGEPCDFYRSKDPVNEPFEKIEGSFDFWDPALFQDDDGRLYLYWGCSNVTPIWGMELDPDTMKPKTERVILFDSDDAHRGYERYGDDHVHPMTETDVWARIDYMLEHSSPEMMEYMKDMSHEEQRQMMWQYMGGLRPYIEGAWMTKFDGKYYLQYAIPGTQCNVYGDGCYVSDAPLGPFAPCKNNPYSYHPGGFMTGAGHGSTLKDKDQNLWHIASMRISMSYQFERRLGLWKASYDKEGGLYCDQRYGDWPINTEAPLFAKPDWMLLSYGKQVTVSSGSGAQNITDEDCRTWWTAEGCDGEWACVDLGKLYDIRGIQINFADHDIKITLPQDFKRQISAYEERWMDMTIQPTQWKLEGSLDGESWFILDNKWEAPTDLAHDFLTWEEGIQARFVKVTVHSLPYNQTAAISGIRVFGIEPGDAPTKPAISAELISPLDMIVSWSTDNAVGAVISWGYAPDRLWHSYMVFDKNTQKIGALVDGEPVYVMVETFNESGSTQSDVICVRK